MSEFEELRNLRDSEKGTDLYARSTTRKVYNTEIETFQIKLLGHFTLNLCVEP